MVSDSKAPTPAIGRHGRRRSDMRASKPESGEPVDSSNRAVQEPAGLPQLLGPHGLVNAITNPENLHLQSQLMAAQQLQGLRSQMYQLLSGAGMTANSGLGNQPSNSEFNQILLQQILLSQQRQHHHPIHSQIQQPSFASMNHALDFPTVAMGGSSFIAPINAAIMLAQANAQVASSSPSPSQTSSTTVAPAEHGGYRDASVLPDPVVFNRNGVNKSGEEVLSAEPFPQKLHRMLSELEKEEGEQEVACFLPHGRAFVIRNPRRFLAEVMPAYFRMSRFSSFQRQLNLYDFRRVAEGPDKGAYYHELFLQGRPALATQMKRTKIKGQQGKWSNTQGGGVCRKEEVDFYALPPIQSSRPAAAAAAPVAPTRDFNPNPRK